MRKLLIEISNLEALEFSRLSQTLPEDPIIT